MKRGHMRAWANGYPLTEEEDRARGRHARIPECCVEFFVVFWRDSGVRVSGCGTCARTPTRLGTCGARRA